MSDLLAIGPAALPALAAVLVLLVDALVPGARSRLAVLAVAAAGLAGGLGLALVRTAQGGWRQALPGPGGVSLWVTGPLASGLVLVVLVAAVLAVALAVPERDARWTARPGPALALLLAVVAGAVTAICAGDLITLTVGAVLTVLPCVALVGLRRGERALAATLALLSTAVTALAALVLGVAVWYAATGSLLLAAAPGAEHRPLHVLGFALVLVGLAFMASAVPGHDWTSPAFLGAPAPVLVLLTVVPRAAVVGSALALLPSLDYLGLGPVNVIAVVALAGLLLGNAMALRQIECSRLLAWVSVAQSGWMLLPLAGGPLAGGPQSAEVLLVVTLALASVITVLGGLALAGEVSLRRLTLPGLRGLARRAPVLGTVLSAGALTLAGLPPLTVGMVAKVAAVQPVLQQPGRWWVAVGAVVGFALGVGVTIRWLRFLWDRPTASSSGVEPMPLTRPVPRVHLVVAILLAGLLAAASLAPQLVLGLVGIG